MTLEGRNRTTDSTRQSLRRGEGGGVILIVTTYRESAKIFTIPRYIPRYVSQYRDKNIARMQSCIRVYMRALFAYNVYKSRTYRRNPKKRQKAFGDLSDLFQMGMRTRTKAAR